MGDCGHPIGMALSSLDWVAMATQYSASIFYNILMKKLEYLRPKTDPKQAYDMFTTKEKPYLGSGFRLSI